jgi:hypothetical protein
MSIQHPDSVGKGRKIFLFETVFHDSVSACTKLTLVYPQNTTGARVEPSNFASSLVLMLLMYEGA